MLTWQHTSIRLSNSLPRKQQMRATPVTSAHEQFAPARSQSNSCHFLACFFDALCTCVHFILFDCALALDNIAGSCLSPPKATV